MDITPKVRENLELLSRVNLDFLAFVEKNPECLNHDNFREMDEARDKLICLQSWPTFLGEKTRKMFREAGVELFNLIKSIPERLFQNDTRKMNAYYAIPKSVLDVQMEGVTREHLDGLLARGDFLFSSSGFKCLEYNIAGNLGGYQLPLWESLYFKNSLFLKFLKEYGVKLKQRNLVGIYLEHCIRTAKPLAARFGDTEINVLQVVSSNSYSDPLGLVGYLNVLYEELLQREKPRLAGNVFLCTFEDLTVENDCLYYRGKKIHVLTEWQTGLMPRRIMKAFNAGNIRIMNGPITHLLSSKLNLALLSEQQHSGAFNRREKEIIEKYVPWTRKIVSGETTYREKKIELMDFVLAHKDKLVLKPSLGYGGYGVYIGKNVSRDQWSELVKTAAAKKDCLAQELVEGGSALYQHDRIGCAVYDQAWGCFLLGSQYGGTFLRVIRSKGTASIVNAAQGAEISIVFDVDE